MTSQTCALELSGLLTLAEFGGEPTPILFEGKDCIGTFGQYPQPGHAFTPNHKVDRLDLCTNESCVLPRVLSAIVPEHMYLKFQAHWNERISSRVMDRGEFVMFTPDGLKKHNIAHDVVGHYDPDTSFVHRNTFNVDHKHLNSPGDQKMIWGSSASKGQRCEKQLSESVSGHSMATHFLHYFDDSGKMRHSSVSCGAPFWPSMNSFRGNLTHNHKVNIRPENNDDTDDDADSYCTSNDVGGTSRGHIGARQFIKLMIAYKDEYVGYTDSNSPFSSAGDHDTTGYHTGDVIIRADEILTGTRQGSNHIDGDKFFDESFDKDSFHHGNISRTCKCDSNTDDDKFCDDSSANLVQNRDNILDGTVETVEALRVTNATWSHLQAGFCLGKEKMTVGGVTVKRYANGSAACQPVIMEFCTNSANIINDTKVTANVGARKACQCVLQKQRILRQFKGAPLPVQCFASVCDGVDPDIFRTPDMKQGCNAKLCIQILNIHGTGIVEQGIQKLSCNGVVYDTSSITPDGGTVPVVTGVGDALDGPTIQIGPSFYVAMGIMALMLFLLVAWGVQRLVSRRRNNRAKKAQQEKSVLGQIR